MAVGRTYMFDQLVDLQQEMDVGGSCDVLLNIEKEGGKVFQRIYQK